MKIIVWRTDKYNFTALFFSFSLKCPFFKRKIPYPFSVHHFPSLLHRFLSLGSSASSSASSIASAEAPVLKSYQKTPCPLFLALFLALLLGVFLTALESQKIGPLRQGSDIDRLILV